MTLGDVLSAVPCLTLSICVSRSVHWYRVGDRDLYGFTRAITWALWALTSVVCILVLTH